MQASIPLDIVAHEILPTIPLRDLYEARGVSPLFQEELERRAERMEDLPSLVELFFLALEDDDRQLIGEILPRLVTLFYTTRHRIGWTEINRFEDFLMRSVPLDQNLLQRLLSSKEILEEIVPDYILTGMANNTRTLGQFMAILEGTGRRDIPPDMLIALEAWYPSGIESVITNRDLALNLRRVIDLYYSG